MRWETCPSATSASAACCAASIRSSYYDGDQVRAVCDLCTTRRAPPHGWIREGTDVAQLAPAAHAERARGRLSARLRGRREPGARRQQRNRPTDELRVARPQGARGAAQPRSGGSERRRGAACTGTEAVQRRASTRARSAASCARSGAMTLHARAEDVLVDLNDRLGALLVPLRESTSKNSTSPPARPGYEPSELGGELSPANAIADERGKPRARRRPEELNTTIDLQVVPRELETELAGAPARPLRGRRGDPR